jgi:hypothetical protein
MFIDRFHTTQQSILYHFTKAESLLKIVKEMQLKFSCIGTLNDLNDCTIDYSIANTGIESINLKKYITQNCKLISFCTNYHFENSQTMQAGYNHPRLWAQYADNNTGACIAINEQKFKEIIYQKYTDRFCIFEPVDYSLDTQDVIYHNTISYEAFVKTHYKHLFFKKHIDWQQEYEERLFIIGTTDQYISILDCVEFIVLGNKFEKKTELEDCLANPQNKCYKQFCSRGFAYQSNSLAGNIQAIPDISDSKRINIPQELQSGNVKE